MGNEARSAWEQKKVAEGVCLWGGGGFLWAWMLITCARAAKRSWRNDRRPATCEIYHKWQAYSPSRKAYAHISSMVKRFLLHRIKTLQKKNLQHSFVWKYILFINWRTSNIFDLLNRRRKSLLSVMVALEFRHQNILAIGEVFIFHTRLYTFKLRRGRNSGTRMNIKCTIKQRDFIVALCYCYNFRINACVHFLKSERRSRQKHFEENVG